MNNNHLSCYEYINIGKIYKNTIFRNSWLAYINNINYINFFQKNKKLIFIKLDGIITPFFIYYYKQIIKNKFLINFDDSVKEENFLGKNLYLNIKELKNNKIEHNNYYYLINYKAIDINNGYIGYIYKINDQLPQYLFEIKNDDNNRIILVPMVDAFIKNINNIKNIILLDLPEGLLDIF